MPYINRTELQSTRDDLTHVLPPSNVGDPQIQKMFDTRIEPFDSSKEGFDDSYFPGIHPDVQADSRMVSTRIIRVIRRRKKRNKSTVAEMFQPSSYVNSMKDYTPNKKRGSI